MKKFYLISLLFVLISIFCFNAFTPNLYAESEVVVPNKSKLEVIGVSKDENSQTSTNSILESRFLNMLNHNFVYDDGFDYVEQIVNRSMPALLKLRDIEDNAFIADTYVSSYIFDMYGITIEDFSDINANFPQKQGFVYIIPTGFSNYNHKIVSVTANEDGSYTVKTKITVSAHDDVLFSDICTSLFVPNAQSSFGYNILFSNIGEVAASI